MIGRINFEPFAVTHRAYSIANIKSDCVSEGHYCVNSPKQKGITGKAVVIEGLRQKCIFKVNPVGFFRYAHLFSSICLDKFSNDCSKKSCIEAGISWKLVSSCIEESFGAGKDTENSLLAADKSRIQKLSTHLYPSIYINGYLYEGSKDPVDILLSVCATLPSQNSQCQEVRLVNDDSLSTSALILLDLAIVLIGVSVAILVCRQIAKHRYQRSLSQVVDKYVTEYSAMSENSTLA